MDSLVALTSHQARFARGVGATHQLGHGSDAGSVYLYRETELTTDRWLVDRRGRVLDTEHFHKVGRASRVGDG